MLLKLTALFHGADPMQFYNDVRRPNLRQGLTAEPPSTTGCGRIGSAFGFAAANVKGCPIGAFPYVDEHRVFSVNSQA